MIFVCRRVFIYVFAMNKLQAPQIFRASNIAFSIMKMSKVLVRTYMQIFKFQILVLIILINDFTIDIF